MIVERDAEKHHPQAELTGMAIEVVDVEGRRLAANNRMVELGDKSMEEFLAGRFGDDLAPGNRENTLEAFIRCVQTGEPAYGILLQWKSHGEPRCGSANLVPLRDKSGRMVGVQVTTADITELVKTQEELRRSQELYRTLVEAVGCSVMRVDREGRRTFVSDYAAEFSGRPREEILSGRFGDTMAPEDRKKAWELLRETFRSGQPVFGLITRQVMRGEVKHISANWVPIKNADEEVAEVQITSTDVTERVRMREQLQLYSTMVSHAQEEERLRISQFLHDDTVQALLAISNVLQCALTGQSGIDPETTKRLEQARGLALDQVQALRRLSMTLRPALLDRMGLDAAVRWLVRETCQNNRVKGSVHIGEGWRRLSPEVEVRLFRIVQEAVNNAIRHGAPSSVQVAMGIENGWLTLSITDDGSGFKQERSEMEFLAKGQLGLAGMRERARELGADLTIVSNVGQGSRVEVRGDLERMGNAVLPAIPAASLPGQSVR